MRHVTLTGIVLLAFTYCIAACKKEISADPIQSNNNVNNNDTAKTKMKITIGATVFTGTLYNNPSATAFKAMLPLTINMSDLNGNEKFYYFPGTLPANPTVGSNIQSGDLMLYSNNCLVMFYEGFSTSYSYTRLGRVDNVNGLAKVLGNGSITVKFDLQ
jgi:hypothetical protein